MTQETPSISGARIVVTGITSEVAKPVAVSLAKDNEVFGCARFRDESAREPLHELGIKTARLDLVKGDLSDLPDDVDYVLHFAVVKSGKWPIDLDGNVSGLLFLMERYQDAKAFLHCSTTAVYQPNDHVVFTEDAPLGDNHRPYFMETYSISKIAAEAAARHGARRYNLPTTIARLNVPYGDGGGWPMFHLAMMEAGQEIGIHPDAPSVFQPIHTDDIVASIPGLLAAAGVPPTIVNWAADERVSIEDWTAYLTELTGLPADLVTSEQTLSSVMVDLSKMHEVIGHAGVHWKDGFRRMVAAQRPDLLKP